MCKIVAQGVEDYSAWLHITTAATEVGRYAGLNGWVKEMSVVTTSGTDSLHIHYYFDADGSIISAVFPTTGDTMAYRYDHRGRLIQTILLHDGDTLTLSRYRYNDTTDRLLETVTDNDFSHRSVYVYSPQGVCRTLYNRRGHPRLQACYRNGWMASTITYNDYWAEPEELLVVLQSDAAGRPILLGDALEPHRTDLHVAYDYDPYGNVTFCARHHDTVRIDMDLYDWHHNWLRQTVIDNGVTAQVTRRSIVYAHDSSDFTHARRSHDPFWTESHTTGFVELHYPNGDYYLGNLLEGERHGQGEIVYANGSGFNGFFHHGRYHGTGRLHRPDADILAQWQHGRIVTDHVDILYADSSTYSGAFHPEGDSCQYEGETRFPDGGFYRGQYAMERYDGHGTLRTADGTRIEGFWLRGHPDGDVLIVMPNLDRHYAHYTAGLRDARCIIEYINGDYYIGQTDSLGIPHGYGSFTNAAGKTKTGYFVAGKYRGKSRPRELR